MKAEYMNWNKIILSIRQNFLSYFALITILLVIFIWFYSSIYITSNYPTPNERGTFGDMFGAVNALFSGLAFVGIIFTILLQRQELKLQREELKLTRIELKRTATAQIASEQALKEANKNHLNTFEIQQLNSRKDTNLNLLNVNYNRLKNEYNLIQFRYKREGKRQVFYSYRALLECIRHSKESNYSKDRFVGGICINEYCNFLVDKYNLISLAFDENYELHIDGRRIFLKNVYNFHLYKMKYINNEILKILEKPENQKQQIVVDLITKIDLILSDINKKYRQK